MASLERGGGSGAADTLAGMVTANVIQRVLNIRIDDSQGSAFTIERGGRQYVVTARHVVQGIEAAQRTAVVFDGEWRNIDFTIVGVAEGDVDVAVLACGLQLSPTLPMEASTDGLVYGQRAYFLGFPFGWTTGGQHLNRGFPLPFVKGGIVAAYSMGGPISTIFLDAHGNQGFSGGPVVFRPQEGQDDFRVAGVVANYPIRFQPLSPDLALGATVHMFWQYSGSTDRSAATWNLCKSLILLVGRAGIEPATP